jgi:hypothetical protein
VRTEIGQTSEGGGAVLYDRTARYWIDAEVRAIIHRYPGLKLKQITEEIRLIAGLPHAFPEKYLSRIFTLNDHAIDQIVAWIEKRHNPGIRSQLGAGHFVHKLATDMIKWTGYVVGENWNQAKIDLFRSWMVHIEAERSDERRVQVGPFSHLFLTHATAGDYFLALLAVNHMRNPPAYSLWTGFGLWTKHRLTLVLKHKSTSQLLIIPLISRTLDGSITLERASALIQHGNALGEVIEVEDTPDDIGGFSFHVGPIYYVFEGDTEMKDIVLDHPEARMILEEYYKNEQ